MARLSLSLLGPVQVGLDGQPLLNFRTNNARVLLVYLSMHPGDFYDRRFLAAMLWPEATPDAASTSLRQTLYHLRQLLGDSEADQPFLRLGHGSLGFNEKSDYQVDALEFMALLQANDTHSHGELESCADCMLRLQTAVDLYRGDFLAGLALPPSPALDEWRVVTQEWLHGRAITAMEHLATYYRRRHSYDQAAHSLRRLLALEPWRQEDHRQLMQVLALNGQPTAALKQFEICCQTLAAELGGEPDPATLELAEQIRTGHFPPPQELSAPDGPLLHISPQEIALSRLPRAETLFGRQAELARLDAWLRSPQVQVVSILGMGGIGKSSLAIHAARNAPVNGAVNAPVNGAANTAANPTGKATPATASHPPDGRNRRVYQHVLWRSLVNAPPLSQVLAEWLQTLTGQQGDALPGSPEDQVDLLVTLLGAHPSLLVLDNLESILDEGERRGFFREGYADYEYLLRSVAEREHQGCLLLTSREKPRLLTRLDRGRSGVCSLPLSGLDGEASRQIFHRWSLRGDDKSLGRVSERYSGNPLALELIAETIDSIYDGDTAAFLGTPATLFGAIADVLDQQFQRLTGLERSLLFWLAVEREPCTIDALSQELIPPQSHPALLSALRGLIHRSLVQQASSAEGTLFYLQNVITEYVTGCLITAVCAEIVAGDLDLLESHALAKATAEAYIYESQQRMILQPVVDRLTAQLGSSGLQTRLRAMVDELRATSASHPGYTAGNLLNLIFHAGFDPQALDFSGLTIRQAYLQNVQMNRVNLSRATLLECSFTQAIGQVMSAALSPENRLLAAVTIRGELLLWRRDNYQPLIHLALGAGSLWSVAFSPDGHQLVCAAGDGSLYFWRVVVSAEQVELVPTHVLAAHKRVVRSVAFRPDGKQLACASEDGTVRLWSAPPATDQMLPFQAERTLTGHTDRVFRVVYSPDSQRVASAGADTEIRLWDTTSGAWVGTLRGHTERIAGLAFSPDGKTLVSGGVDQDIRIWNVESGECVRVLSLHRYPLLAVAFSPDGRLLASAGHSTSVRLWETQSWQPIKQLSVAGISHTEVWSLQFNPQGTELMISGEVRPISIWDIRSDQCIFMPHNWEAEIWLSAFDPSGRWAVTGDHNGHLLFWDTEKRASAHPAFGFQADNSGVVDIGFAAQTQQMIIGSRNGSIQIWHLGNADGGSAPHLMQRWPPLAHGHGLSRLTLTRDEKFLLAANHWGEILIWTVRTNGELNPHPLHRIQAHNQAVLGLAVHPQGHLAASGGDDRLVRLWDIASGAPLDEFGGFRGRIVSVDFTADGTSVVASDAVGTVVVWHSVERRVSHSYSLPTGEIHRVKLVADGMLAVGGVGEISLWQLGADGSVTCTQCFRGHTAAVEDLQLHPTQPLLVSASSDGSARLWDIRSGESLAVWRNPGPYWGTNIHAIQGLTPAQKNNLLALGAVDEAD